MIFHYKQLLTKPFQFCEKVFYFPIEFTKSIIIFDKI